MDQYSFLGTGNLYFYEPRIQQLAEFECIMNRRSLLFCRGERRTCDLRRTVIVRFVYANLDLVLKLPLLYVRCKQARGDVQITIPSVRCRSVLDRATAPSCKLLASGCG